MWGVLGAGVSGVTVWTGVWRYCPRSLLLATGLIDLLVSVYTVAEDQRATPTAIAWAAVAAVFAWTWWRRRPPRKRKESKTMARVRDLGHRLVTE